MFRSVDRQTGSYPENEVLYGFATIQELASTAAVGRLDTRVEIQRLLGPGHPAIKIIRAGLSEARTDATIVGNKHFGHSGSPNRSYVP